MDYDVEVMQLSQKFWADYPHNQYPELLQKSGRPYNCLLVDTHMDYFICIPFRSNISHNNAYLFQNTQRSKRTRSGLDYQKSVIIKDTTYFSNAPAVVDQDEYKEAMQNMNKIVEKVTKYVDRYIAHINGTKPLHHRAFSRDYLYSTLPYFHDVLGLPR